MSGKYTILSLEVIFSWSLKIIISQYFTLDLLKMSFCHLKSNSVSKRSIALFCKQWNLLLLKSCGLKLKVNIADQADALSICTIAQHSDSGWRGFSGFNLLNVSHGRSLEEDHSVLRSLCKLQLVCIHNSIMQIWYQVKRSLNYFCISSSPSPIPVFIQAIRFTPSESN